jgi:hypothetical protein
MLLALFQWRRKWGTVSSWSGQCGHDGLSVFAIWCRCLFSGARPVRSWNRMAAWRFARSEVSFRKDPDGRLSLTARAEGPWGDF